ncbi:putative receptor-like protein kinase [Capsicum baccatum]|uniref:Receptor-like protein kinase n=1 Tax=Capsicum baccatum TaxID=33114 RepID=A0A2G2VK99_CAPBA|nr:putative receptor-like protein kinase [Capsicum baccatum]
MDSFPLAYSTWANEAHLTESVPKESPKSVKMAMNIGSRKKKKWVKVPFLKRLRDNGDSFLKSQSYRKAVAVDGINAEESWARSEGSGYRRNMKVIVAAVKVLSGLKGNGEEFINEVASISKTSHVNIVSLVGFCFEGRKRALVYEFMPNGSLEKFIYEERSENVRQLGWPILYKIGLGIARGLEYLHRGCTTRILHFDA